MQASDTNHQPYEAPEFPNVCVASGWGAKVSTKYNHLIVEDGSGRRRRIRRYNRATAPFDRLIITAATGYISFSAIHWCRDAGIGVYQIDRDGTVIAVSGDFGADRPELRRAQAKAAGRPIGLQIARRLVAQKVREQARVAASLQNPVRIRVPGLSRAKTTTDLLAVEAEIASQYWQACHQIPLRFAANQLSRIAEHWTIFGQRSSPITGTPRMAGSPAGAMLNFLYAILVAEARLACLAMGLDPGLGVYHVDKPGRDSLVYDLIEPIRPAVDEWLFKLFEEHVFTIGDFAETRRGAVRVNPPLSDHLAATGPLWASHLAPIVEETATRFLPDGDISRPLTQTRRGRTSQRSQEKGLTGPPRAKTPAQRCQNCGVQVGERSRYCDQCRPQALIEAGQRSAARRLQTGESLSAKRKRSAAMKKRRRSNIKWDKQDVQPDPEVFRTQILPKLVDVPLQNMVKATGLSKSYCSLIRRGEVTPHPSHWEALDAIGQTNA